MLVNHLIPKALNDSDELQIQKSPVNDLSRNCTEERNLQSTLKERTLQSMKFCNFKEASCSEDSVYSECDSGSDYVPLSQMHSKDIIDGSSDSNFLCIRYHFR